MASKLNKLINLSLLTLTVTAHQWVAVPLAQATSMKELRTVNNKLITSIVNDPNGLYDKVNYLEHEIKVNSDKSNENLNLNLVARIKPLKINNKDANISNLFIDGQKAYISYCTAGDKFGGGVQIINLKNPWKPVLEAELKITDTDIYSLMVHKNKLFITGTTDSGEFHTPAILQVIELKNDNLNFTSEIKRINLPSYAGTSMAVQDNKLLVTTGSFGGLTEINLDTYEKERFILLPEAKNVRVNEDNKVTVFGGTPERLFIFDKYPEKYHSFGFNTSENQVTQSTLEFNTNTKQSELKPVISLKEEAKTAYLGMGSRGVIGMNISTGKTLFSYKPKTGITRDISVNRGLAFLANGRAGVEVMKISENSIKKLGRIDLFNKPYTTNLLEYKNNVLLAETEEGGLNILLTSENTSIDPISKFSRDF